MLILLLSYKKQKIKNNREVLKTKLSNPPPSLRCPAGISSLFLDCGFAKDFDCFTGDLMPLASGTITHALMQIQDVSTWTRCYFIWGIFTSLLSNPH